MINCIEKRKKIILSVRLLPSIILVLASLAFSIAYIYPKYAETYRYIQAGGLFGFALFFLVIDVGLEYSYKNQGLPYHIASTVISVGQLSYFGAMIFRYIKDLQEGDDLSKRIFPMAFLVILLLINTLYRVLIWLNKWKTEEKNGNDLYAAYIGFLGLGGALLNSLVFSAIKIYSEDLISSYVGIFAIISFLSCIIEAIIGVVWLSFKKVRSSSKSNIFFYITIFSLFANIAALITASFGYGYQIVSMVVGVFSFASYSISILFIGLGLFYLSYLGKKSNILK